MTEESPGPSIAEPQPIRSSMGLRWWFLGGFILVFVGFLLFKTELSWHPSGQGLVQCKLWQYYIIEIRRVSFFTSTVGPISGSGTALLKVLVQHLVISGIGGIFSLGLGAIIRRFNK